jgi:6-phosphofructokinase 1
MGGSELGTNRKVPKGRDLSTDCPQFETHKLDGLLIIGGWEGYETAFKCAQRSANFPAFNIPIVCLPASINNNLPGSELSIGADTALNNIVEAVDKIKQSAVATRRCLRGRGDGPLLRLPGADERHGDRRRARLLHEEGVSLQDLQPTCRT